MYLMNGDSYVKSLCCCAPKNDKEESKRIAIIEKELNKHFDLKQIIVNLTHLMHNQKKILKQLKIPNEAKEKNLI